MTREYMRILLADLDDWIAQGWQPAERGGAVPCIPIHGGLAAVCLVWRVVEEPALLADQRPR